MSGGGGCITKIYLGGGVGEGGGVCRVDRVSRVQCPFMVMHGMKDEGMREVWWKSSIEGPTYS